VEKNQLVAIQMSSWRGKPAAIARAEKQTPSASILFFRTNWCVFIISKCREESDLGMSITSVLAKRMRLRSAGFQRVLRPNTFLNRKSPLCTLISKGVTPHVKKKAWNHSKSPKKIGLRNDFNCNRFNFKTYFNESPSNQIYSQIWYAFSPYS